MYAIYPSDLAQLCKAAFYLQDETEQAWMYIQSLGVPDAMKKIKSTKTFEAIDSTAVLVVKAVHVAFTPLEK